MEDVVVKFNRIKKELFDKFSIDNNYYVKSLKGYKWTITKLEDMYFIKYWKDGENIVENVVVKKDEKPLISTFKANTMVIVIDCVKVALIFDENLKNE